jgi:hypothetical protein
MTSLKAECATGTAACKADGTGYDACVPDVMPTANDDCAALKDTSCDGTIDCACQAGTTLPCASGLPGVCAAGTQTCTSDGTGYAACVASVMPSAMAEDCKAIGDEDCDGVACSECEWSFLVGNAQDQDPTSIAVDSAGNILVAGSFYDLAGGGTVTLLNKANNTSVLLTNAGLTDLFLAKFSPKGDVLWAKSFGDATFNAGSIYVAVDANDNVGIAGGVSGTVDFGTGPVASVGGGTDIFAVKYDPQGAQLWTKRFGPGTSTNHAESIAFDTAGNMLIGGAFSGPLTVGATMLPGVSGQDAFVIKLAGTTGTVTWAKQYTESSGQPTGIQVVHALTTDSANDVYITGEFTGSIFLSSNHTAVGYDGFLAKLAGSTGAVLWDRVISSAGADQGRDLAVDSSDSVLVTGQIRGDCNFGGGLVAAPAGAHPFLAKYTKLGAYLNAKTFPSSSGGSGSAVTTDLKDNVYLTGQMTTNLDLGGGLLTGAGSIDIFLGKFDSNLNPIWSKNFGDGGLQAPLALRYDKVSNRLVLTGEINSTVNFGTGALTSAGAADIGLAKFQP